MPTTTPTFEKHYSPQQIGAVWGISANTVRRIFQDMPGVMTISLPRRLVRGKDRAPRTTLRIPASVAEIAHQQRSRGFDPEVQRRSRGI
jgi:hypothetical protein